ncbi:(R,S)-reticuline 7-O-methyltransferase-like [Euphorbia lathyris]|uniref:(R,S)-reticuline 7-O-methyltransferase-like n=1 Tax=Euphorbia lathyris TaxID=212925 RepID=UPI00331357C5
MESITEREALMRGQAEIWKFMFGFADSMVLKAAVELAIPDIINSHSHPISLSQIASGIDSSSVDMAYLARIMRYLVHKKIFTSHHPPSSSGEIETLYGLTQTSKWILKNSDLTLNPMVIMQNHPSLITPWHYLSQSVKEGETPFKKAHGCEVWDFAAKNSEFNTLFNDALGCTAKIVIKAVLGEESLKCFDGVMSLVDVGGGTGEHLVEILKVKPEIKGVNFDLIHVVSTAPEFEGIVHVGGDMFDVIPKGDAIFMKWILHDWGDENCVKILRNCRKAIPEKTGKLILVEIVLEEDGDNQFGEMGLVFDLLMFAHTSGGKERTEVEWKKLLEDGGFPRYKIIKIPALPSIIEAYPL